MTMTERSNTIQREMERTKEEWEQKKKVMEKRSIKWEWIDKQQHLHKGEYEGEVKNDVPHGQGKWER